MALKPEKQNTMLINFTSNTSIRTFIYFLIYLGFSVGKTFGQDFIQKASKSVGTGLIASTSGQNPFWLRSNQYGAMPFSSNAFYAEANINKAYDSTYTLDKKLTKFNFGYGINTLAFVGKTNTIMIPEAYLKIRYGVFEAFVGRKKETIGLVDTTLTSGSFAYSNNALPIPKIQISIPNYVNIDKSGLISFKGNFAFGTLGKQYYVKNQVFHHKSLYGKLGKNAWPVNVIAGFTHQIQMGGELNNIKTLKSIAGNKFPGSFSDYLYAVTGLSLNTTKSQIYLDPDNYTSYDLTNRVGNHFGNIDIGASIKNKFFDINIYRQSVYDDGSLYYLNNIADGLKGISFSFKKQLFEKYKLNKVVIEYFNSSSQGGPIPPGKEVNPETRGVDNYFNHGQFLDGWAYNNKTIGNPFITPYKDTNENLPRYLYKNLADKEVSFFTNNNRVKSVYMAIQQEVYDIHITLKASLSKNYGTYKFPFNSPINQLSLGAFALTHIKKINKTVVLNCGYDSYGVFKQNFGTNMGIRQAY